jgi:hypothetical protein
MARNKYDKKEAVYLKRLGLIRLGYSYYVVKDGFIFSFIINNLSVNLDNRNQECGGRSHCASARVAIPALL